MPHLCPFPKISWCGFGSPSGFRRPSSLFSKDFLARETFFQKYGANFKGHQGHRLACGGGGVLLCVASLRSSCPASCLPASCPVHLQKIGLPSVSVGVLGLVACCVPLGLLLYRLPAYLVKIGTNGANFQPVSCPVLLGKFSDLEENTFNRCKGLQSLERTKKHGLCRVVLVCCFSLLVSEHCKRLRLLAKYPYLTDCVIVFYLSSGGTCNIIEIAFIVCFGVTLAPKYGYFVFHLVGVFSVVCFSCC